MVGEHVDPETPNVARMYDYYLGGKDNFAADREAAERIMKIMPHAAEWVRANRGFLARAVRLLSESGIRQFIDIGTGLPTRESAHQVAGRMDAESRVVYVDIDPVVVSHGRALLATDERSTVIQADLRRPDDILSHPETRALIDFDRPVGLLLVAVLQFIPDDREVSDVLTRLRAALAPGSHLVISHITADEVAPAVAGEGREIYATTSLGSITPRSPSQVATFFDGLELLEPGLVGVEHWRAAEPPAGDRVPLGFLGAVARR
ncbi:SAM-dependent methyltransferase [Actinoallomurus oryzae]|uniref:SAM-dependent methyltransferase n=1 Tax=Actinoallomurus oryzae TaxID=502180 RepID=UPI0031EEC44D